MEKRICKRCGDVFYFESEYCMSCKGKIELERLGNLSEGEIQNEYAQIAKDILDSGKLEKTVAERLKNLMMVCDKANPRLQVVCAKLDVYDIPEVFIGADSMVVAVLEKKWSEGGKKNFDLKNALDMAKNCEESITRCSTECYELIPDEFDIPDDDVSKVKLRIITPEGKSVEFEDFYGDLVNDSLPYDMIGKERPDNGIVVTYRQGRSISAFLPRFSEFGVNAYGGYAAWDFDDFETCDVCDGDLEHIAQIDGKPFHFDDGKFMVSRCKDCGKYVIQYFQS